MGDNYDDIYRGEIHKLDADEEYTNGAYTETGDQVYCDWCGEEMHFDPRTETWCCKGCRNSKNRVQWFDFLDANPPGHKCLTQCRENYPVCKNWCMLYNIPDDDPIL